MLVYQVAVLIAGYRHPILYNMFQCFDVFGPKFEYIVANPVHLLHMKLQRTIDS